MDDSEEQPNVPAEDAPLEETQSEEVEENKEGETEVKEEAEPKASEETEPTTTEQTAFEETDPTITEPNIEQTEQNASDETEPTPTAQNSTEEAKPTTAEPDATEEAKPTTAEPDATEEAKATAAEPDATEEAKATPAEPDATEEAKATPAEPDATEEAKATPAEPDATKEPEPSSTEPSTADAAKEAELTSTEQNTSEDTEPTTESNKESNSGADTKPSEDVDTSEDQTKTSETTGDYSSKSADEMMTSTLKATNSNDEAPEEDLEDERRKKKEKANIPEDFFYKEDEWVSKPQVTTDSGLPDNVLSLHHSFGYDCLKCDNINLLDDDCICFVAGNLLQFYKLKTKEQSYLRSSSGGGIGAVTVHHNHEFFAVAEKGESPNVLIFTYPELKLYRILRGGTQTAYSYCQFSPDGTLLATVGSEPDFMLTVWDWKNEQTVLRCKAFSQEIFRVSWSSELEGILTTSGTGHIRFWKMADTFTGLKLQGFIGKFGKTEISDIEGYVELPDGKVLSGCEWGNMLLWDGGLIKVQVTRKQRKPCHNGPIQQIVMDEGELMTVGIDGYIRTWDFEAIDTAEASDETAYFELEPMNEMRVSHDVKLKHIVKSLEEDSTIWFAQDANGGIWKLDLSFSHTSLAPEKLSSFHAGPIVGCVTSPLSYLAATIGHDSSVKIYDFAAKKLMAESQFTANGCSILWAPGTVDSKGKTVLAGFSDGVVRVLCFGENPESDPTRRARQVAKLSLVTALKPHGSAVRAMAFDEEGEFFVTGGDDATIFFFSVTGQSYEPIGFIKVPDKVKELEWLHQEGSALSVIVYLEHGGACEVVCPDPATVDHSKTFEIVGLEPHHHYCFQSTKSRLRHEEYLETVRQEDEARRKRKEQEFKHRREKGQDVEEEIQKWEEEERDIARKRKEEEEAWEPFIPEEPSPLLYAKLTKAKEPEFWFSMGAFDAGYLYKCQFASDAEKSGKEASEYDKPRLAVPVLDSSDVPICSIHYSASGKRALFGMQDGSIRVQQLHEAFDLSQMGASWRLTFHDNHYGHINSLCTSFDDKFVLSVGNDGNFFVSELMSEELQEQHVAEYKAKIPSARKVVGPPADDIDDPHAYSIEEHKQKSEHDRMVKLAEEKKSATRRRINDLRKEFKRLKDQNETLPERSRIDKKELDLVPELREDLLEAREEKVKLVHREMAWESEKYQIALDKLKKRFRNYVECDHIVVKAFRSRHEVRTSRAAILSEEFFNLKLEMERKRTNVGTFEPTRDATSTSQKKDTEEDLDGTGNRGDTVILSSNLQGARGERIARQLKKVEEKKKKRALRKSQWQALYHNKPDDDYEDPLDVSAIKEAKENMGDFKLKTASDYVVPDHMRMNTDKARTRLVDIEERIHDLRFAMNNVILGLRDKKIGIIAETEKIRARLLLIQGSLEPSECKQMPPVPGMTFEETPEKVFDFTRDSLLAFKKEMESQRLAQIKGEEPSGFGSFSKQQPQISSTQFTSSGSKRVKAGIVEKMLPLEDQDMEQPPALSELQKSRIQKERIRVLYEQDRLLNRVDQMLRNFDAELLLVRHDKMGLDSRLMKAELRQLTLYEEYLLLKEFEKSEKGLANKVEKKHQEKSEMQAKLLECQSKLEAKKKDIEKLQEREKLLHENFRQSLGENNKFFDYLTKVFKKKIKRKKKEADGGDSDDEDESSDDDDSEWDESEEESDEEGVSYDLDMCPPGCDQTLYDSTCQLREKRLDFEEELAEEKKIQDSLKKESESLQKKSKIIDGALRQAENDLEEFQLKKQKKLNELDVVVILKLHQLLYHENTLLPGDLSPTLVFERNNLMHLRHRIRELEDEKQQQKRQQKEAKRRHIQLMKDRKIYQAHINDKQEECDLMMVQKFGKIEDLERLEQVIVNPKVEELTVKMLMLQEEQLRELAQRDDLIREAQEQVIEQTRENTQRLTQMLMLYNERLETEQALDSRQKNLGSEYRGARAQEVEEMTRLVQLVQIQAQELNALKEEIGMLSRKGGHILPPVQPPVPPEKGPMVP